MDTLIRSLWLVRAWTAAALVGTGVLSVALYPAVPTAAGLVLAIAVEAAAVLAQAAYVRALADGSRGEVLMQSGARVPIATVRRLRTADGAEVAATVVVGVLGGVSGVLAGSPSAPVAVVAAGLSVLLQVGIFRQRRWSHLLAEALVALLAYDLARAESWLRQLAGAGAPVFRTAVEGLRTHLLLVRGERDAALRAMEAAWDGALDDRAATLATVRLGAGDPSLAERWLAATQAPRTRYERYLVALVGAHLALHGARWDEALAAARRTVDVPDPYLRQLALLAVAALQGAGRTDDARAALAQIRPGLEVEAWRRVAHPRQWRLLEDAAAGRPTHALPAPVAVDRALPDVAPAGDVFAPPEAVPVARPGRVGTGAVPVEGLLLADRRPRALRVVALATTGVLVALSGAMVTLLLLVAAMGAGDGRDAWLLQRSAVLGAVGLLLGIATLAAPVLAWTSRHQRPAVVLADGRRVAFRWFAAWSVAVVLPQLAAAVLLVLLLGFLEGQGGERWLYLVGLPFGLLYVWGAWRRWSAARLVRALHVLPAAQAVAVAERGWRRGLPGQGHGRAWLALARLWAGDEAGAERDAREAALVHPELGWIEAWLRAGRGEVDLERVLAEPDPFSLGDRYRRAVTVALAALRAGAADRVADRVGDWTEVADQLPNRFGALLSRLVVAVRRANGEPVEPLADPDLAWVGRVWPFVR